MLFRWLVLGVLLFSSALSFARPESPLAFYFQNTELLSSESHQLSATFQRPIVLLKEQPTIDWVARKALLHNLMLPEARNIDHWWSRYEAGLLQNIHSGFSLKQPDNLALPCIISIGSSYSEHVKQGGVFNRLTQYNYHPYLEQPELYSDMVLWHEVGHCFEAYGGFLGEVYADIFMALMISNRSKQNEIVDHQINMRWLELIDGDGEHFSAHVLKQLRSKIHSYHNLDIRSAPGAAHLLLGSMTLTEQDLVKRNHWIADYYRNRVTTRYIDDLLSKFGETLSDREEQIYDVLVTNRDTLALKMKQSQPLSLVQQAEIMRSTRVMISAMYQIRENRNDLFNDIQVAQFRQDVQLLVRILGVELDQLPAELSDADWLKKVAQLN